jgi:hypothetical protein
MPTTNPDALREKTAALRTRLREKGDSLDGAKRRALEKKIRRLQRKRRRIAVKLAQSKPKASAENKEGQPSP